MSDGLSEKVTPREAIASKNSETIGAPGGEHFLGHLIHVMEAKKLKALGPISHGNEHTSDVLTLV